MPNQALPVTQRALIRKVDCVQLRVNDLDAGLTFYRDQLGQELVWRTGTSAGLRMPDTDAELVLQTERDEFEVDLLVASADAAAEHFIALGDRVIAPPFDVQIGRCVVVQDPWGNQLVLIDASKGLLRTDSDGNVIGNLPQ